MIDTSAILGQHGAPASPLLLQALLSQQGPQAFLGQHGPQALFGQLGPQALLGPQGPLAHLGGLPFGGSPFGGSLFGGSPFGGAYGQQGWPQGPYGQQTWPQGPYGQQGWPQGPYGQQAWPMGGGFGQPQFSGALPPALLAYAQSQIGHFPGGYGQQTWPPIGGGLGVPQLPGLLPYLQPQFALPALIAGGYGQFGAGQLGRFLPIEAMLAAQGLAPQIAILLGQLHHAGQIGRGILPYQAMPQMAYAGC